MQRLLTLARARWKLLAVGAILGTAVGLGSTGDEDRVPEGDETLAVVDRVALGGGPWAMTALPGGVAIVTRHPDRLITARWDGRRIRLGSRIVLPAPPQDVTAAGPTVWVADSRYGLRAYRDGRRVHSVRIPRGAYRVAVAGRELWAIDGYGKPALWRLDRRTGRVRAAAEVRVGAEDLAGAPDGSVLAMGGGRVQRVFPGADRAGRAVDTGERATSRGEVRGGDLWFAGQRALIRLPLDGASPRERTRLSSQPVFVDAGRGGVVAASPSERKVTLVGLDGKVRATARTLVAGPVALQRGGTVWSAQYDRRALVALRVRP